MTTQRIEDQPDLLQQFTARVGRGYPREAVVSFLTSGSTIDESTLQQLPAGQHQDVRLAIKNYEGQLGRKILMAAHDTQLPHVRTVPRAVFQLRHLDMFEDFGAALQVLERFAVSATLADITPEFAAWARERSTMPAFADRIAKHIDFAQKKDK